MPRSVLVPQSIPAAGLAPVLASANVDGHSVVNVGRIFLEVANASGVPVAVTIPTPGTVDGLAIDDRVVSVPAAGRRLIPIGSGATFNQPAPDEGSVFVNITPVASVTIGAFRL